VVDLNDKDETKGIKAATKMLEDANLEVNDENIFIAGACKEKGIMFLQGKGTIGVRKNEPKKETSSSNAEGYTVKLNGKKYSVKLEGSKATVNGKTYDIDVKEGIEETNVSSTSTEGTPIKAALPGVVIRTEVSVGDEVQEGDVLLVVEAMKMETEIKSPQAGKVLSVDVSQGDQVKNGQVLVTLG
ncbi:biotin/lipoyl-binding protein, partial [bacterium]|nr:biotin/lipoyl-binding protein [bacterium]